MSERKVWEEEWRVRNSPGCSDDIYSDADPKGYVFSANGLEPLGAPGYEAASARAKLAAAAPEMARLLMDLEYAGSEDGSPACPSCRIPEGVTHYAHCKLAVALRKAGIEVRIAS